MLKNVRHKPEYVKRRVSVMTAALLTLLIAGVWASVSGVSDRAPETQAAALGKGPLDSIIEDVKTLFSGEEAIIPPTPEEDTRASDQAKVSSKPIYFDPERDPGEFDGAVYAPDPRADN
jgi:hypothetical protein